MINKSQALIAQLVEQLICNHSSYQKSSKNYHNPRRKIQNNKKNCTDYRMTMDMTIDASQPGYKLLQSNCQALRASDLYRLIILIN